MSHSDRTDRHRARTHLQVPPSTEADLAASCGWSPPTSPRDSPCTSPPNPTSASPPPSLPPPVEVEASGGGTGSGHGGVEVVVVVADAAAAEEGLRLTQAKQFRRSAANREPTIKTAPRKAPGLCCRTRGKGWPRSLVGRGRPSRNVPRQKSVTRDIHVRGVRYVSDRKRETWPVGPRPFPQ